jgi:hypothetical protein
MAGAGLADKRPVDKRSLPFWGPCGIDPFA